MPRSSGRRPQGEQPPPAHEPEPARPESEAQHAAETPESPPGQTAENRIAVRQRQYLVAKQPALLPFSVAALDLDNLLDELERDPECEVTRTIAPASAGMLSTGPGGEPSPLEKVLVVRMGEDKATDVDRHPQVLLEEDALLQVAPVGPPTYTDRVNPAALVPFGTATTWALRVQSSDGSPVKSTVCLYGSGYPAQGVTDDAGQISLSLQNESDETVRSLFVNPDKGHWSLWVDAPRLQAGTLNVISVEPIATVFAEFPTRQLLGWGERAMRLDAMPPGFSGAGVKVAVVDSGADSAHPDLASVTAGRDLTTDPADDSTWRADAIAHGSHCAGVVAGSDSNAGIRGFAPAAEVHALKVFPGGRFSALLDALDYCIDQGVDVVNMSLGSGAESRLISEKIRQAKDAGVACIVAAGNSGGKVQFPGTSPDVLTVAALGQRATYPDSSFHARQVWTGPAEERADGFFSASFSCFGPEVDLCAPGVAVVSSVPGSGYAAWDGTSMAAPHVTGLAALVLAHHPDFRGSFRTRNAARVDRLFELLRRSATAVDVGDTARTGAGLPDAPRALGLEPSTRTDLPPTVADATAVVRALLAELGSSVVASGLLDDVTGSAAPQSMIPAARAQGGDDPGSSPAHAAHDVHHEAVHRDLDELEQAMAAAGLLLPLREP